MGAGFVSGLAPGTRLGSYDVIALIDQGGMREVCQARDTKLNRADPRGHPMRTATTVGVFTICMLWLGAAGANVQTCEPDGEVQFLCGPVSPEDLAPVPQSPWVVVSSMVDG